MDEDNSKQLQSLMEHLDTLYSECETFTESGGCIYTVDILPLFSEEY